MFARLNALKTRKGIIDAKIQQEAGRPQPDMLRLQSLKRQRLRVKDRIVELGRSLRSPGHRSLSV